MAFMGTILIKEQKPKVYAGLVLYIPYVKCNCAWTSPFKQFVNNILNERAILLSLIRIVFMMEYALLSPPSPPPAAKKH